MLRLAMPTEPEWLDMPHGVRLLARPMTAAIDTAANIAVERALRDAGTAMTEEMRIGLALQLRAELLAAEMIAAWEGVADAEGVPLALTRDNAALLMRSSAEVMLAFVTQVRAPLERATAEGNA